MKTSKKAKKIACARRKIGAILVFIFAVSFLVFSPEKVFATAENSENLANFKNNLQNISVDSNNFAQIPTENFAQNPFDENLENSKNSENDTNNNNAENSENNAQNSNENPDENGENENGENAENSENADEKTSLGNLIISEIVPRICPKIDEIRAENCGNNDAKLGAFVEIFNNSDEIFARAGWKIFYATATEKDNFEIGEKTLLAEIDENISPHAYFLAQKFVNNARDGYVILENENGEIVDFVGYGSAAQNATNLSANLNESLARCELTDGNLDEFAIFENPTPREKTICAPENAENSDEKIPEKVENNCENLVLSEIGANLENQFIEVQNISPDGLKIGGCRLMTNRSTTKFYAFSDEILPANSFKTVEISATDLTLTKTTKGTVYLLNSTGENEIDAINYENLKENTSFAKIGENWRQTFAPTLNATNIFLEFPACDDGYFRNLETGKCNKIAAAASLAPCDAGEFRNPATGRCKKIAPESAVLEPCAEGYERNPLTNRCRKIASENAELTECAEGWERNPETNRCRKIVESAPAQFAVKNDGASSSGSAWKWLVGGIFAAMCAIISWQYRAEIARNFARFLHFFARKKSGEKSEGKINV